MFSNALQLKINKIRTEVEKKNIHSACVHLHVSKQLQVMHIMRRRLSSALKPHKIRGKCEERWKQQKKGWKRQPNEIIINTERLREKRRNDNNIRCNRIVKQESKYDRRPVYLLIRWRAVGKSALTALLYVALPAWLGNVCDNAQKSTPNWTCRLDKQRNFIIT